MIRKRTIMALILVHVLIFINRAFELFLHLKSNDLIVMVLGACICVSGIAAFIYVVTDIKNIMREKKKRQKLPQIEQNKKIIELKRWLILSLVLYFLAPLILLFVDVGYTVYASNTPIIIFILLPISYIMPLIACFLIHNKIFLIRQTEEMRLAQINTTEQNEKIIKLKHWRTWLLVLYLIFPSISFTTWYFDWNIYVAFALDIPSIVSIVACMLVHNKICRIKQAEENPMETEKSRV